MQWYDPPTRPPIPNRLTPGEVVLQGPEKPTPKPANAYGAARCDYCGRYGALGRCDGCGAPNKPVQPRRIDGPPNVRSTR